MKKGYFEKDNERFAKSEFEKNPDDQNLEDKKAAKKGSCIGWGILGFFLPLVGLILFLVWLKKNPKSAKSAGIGALVGLVVTILLIAVLIAAGKNYYNSMLDKINIVEMSDPVYGQETQEAAEAQDTAPTEEKMEEWKPHPGKPVRSDYVNFLLVGQAAREGETARMADTMMVCTLNKYDNSLTVTSLLRDSYVHPPLFRNVGFGQIKLTIVYHLGSYYDGGKVSGSMELMNNTLYENFGIEIDHNIEVSFESFETVINALGGIDVELTESEAKYLNEFYETHDYKDAPGVFTEGMNHLDGYSALTYARMRKAEGDGGSDIKRTERQRKVMGIVMDKVKSMPVSEIKDLADTILPMITTNMSREEITETIATVLPMLPSMEFKSGGTCPHEYSGDMVEIYHDGVMHSVLRFSPDNEKRYMRELTLGEVPEDK